MNREFLTKAIADAKTAYFESIARLIVENPTVKLTDLRRKYDISRGDMSKAQRLFQIHRKRGKGSSAAKKDAIEY
jgi:hypothetical protein